MVVAMGHVNARPIRPSSSSSVFLRTPALLWRRFKCQIFDLFCYADNYSRMNYNGNHASRHGCIEFFLYFQYDDDICHFTPTVKTTTSLRWQIFLLFHLIIRQGLLSWCDQFESQSPKVISLFIF